MGRTWEPGSTDEEAVDDGESVGSIKRVDWVARCRELKAETWQWERTGIVSNCIVWRKLLKEADNALYGLDELN